MPRQFFKKFINLAESTQVPPLHGEILYTKNNVCIHPPGLLSNSILHHTGFLTITAKVENGSVSLVLRWSPTNKTRTLQVVNGEDLTQTNGACETPTVAEDAISSSATTTSLSESSSCDGVYNISSSIDESEGTHKNNLEVNDCCDKSKSPLAVHNFEFPENSIEYKKEPVPYQGYVIRPPKNQAFGPFTVDLAHMRSLRLYFRNEGCTNGELIIASHEAQYKVLHFHHGGLDCVASVFKDWKTCVQQDKNNSQEMSINHFSVTLPQLTLEQCHPEEGLYRGLTSDAWSLYIDEFGKVQNQQNIQKAVFFGGVEKALRPAVWPFLLKYYKFDSTGIERTELQLKKSEKYQRINAEREKLMEVAETDEFWRNVTCSVEKDVLRTDRANPFYQGEGNPNLDILQRILLNYSAYTKTGYTQGMSDLLSPILMEIQEESNVFWCFVGLMQRTIFISSPSDQDMEKQLLYLRELLRILVPKFYSQMLVCGPGASELLFTHRWILLCFKREFTESEALKIWEACWAHYQTNYFHLFICVAIISLYGTDVAESKLASDEMLLHFSHLSLQMNGALVLRKARGLLHNIRMSASVPCTLHDLLCVAPSGGWETQHIPRIKCVKRKECENGCPHGGTVDQSDMIRSKLGKFFQQ